MSIAHCGGRCDWRVGILAAFVALADTMEVAVAQGTPGLAPDGWGRWLSGIFALLCIAAPLVSAISIVFAGGPMFQLPKVFTAA